MATEEELETSGLVQCWCGAIGRYYELFMDDCLDSTCGGSGVLHCDCGGDFCVCHHHGEVQCDGCEDCMCSDDDGFDGYSEADEDLFWDGSDHREYLEEISEQERQMWAEHESEKRTEA